MSGAVWKLRWPSWAPVPNKPTVSVDVKQHFIIVATQQPLRDCATRSGHHNQHRMARTIRRNQWVKVGKRFWSGRRSLSGLRVCLPYSLNRDRRNWSHTHTHTHTHISLSLSLALSLSLSLSQGQICKKADTCLNLYPCVIKYYLLSSLCVPVSVCLSLSKISDPDFIFSSLSTLHICLVARSLWPFCTSYILYFTPKTFNTLVYPCRQNWPKTK